MFGFTKEPDGLETKAERTVWKKANKKWDGMDESDRFDLIQESFHNSNLSNINDLSEKEFGDLPEDMQHKLMRKL